MTRLLLATLGLGGLVAAALCASSVGAERSVSLPRPAQDVHDEAHSATAVFAGGCFWGMEAVFERVKGVTSVTAGYDGGSRATAHYGAVSRETTGHAEAVRITFDPQRVSYGTLLQIFFSVAHDPTQLNRQTPDVGPSYRSAIFPQNTVQRRVATAYIAQLQRARLFNAPIVTSIETGRFYPAESYHQRFYDRNPNNPYIVRWDKPRVAAFEAAFPNRVK